MANLLCQHGYFFPVGECNKNLSVKDDSSLYRFQVPVLLPSRYLCNRLLAYRTVLAIVFWISSVLWWCRACHARSGNSKPPRNACWQLAEKPSVSAFTDVVDHDHPIGARKVTKTDPRLQRLNWWRYFPSSPLSCWIVVCCRPLSEPESGRTRSHLVCLSWNDSKG